MRILKGNVEREYSNKRKMIVPGLVGHAHILDRDKWVFVSYDCVVLSFAYFLSNQTEHLGFVADPIS
ncbi:hypothetical protein C1H46_005738 [Malus baccata]|uniref:Uncharacterized protein n=1 Tax=Malus baccata TaxID=106549 RepID=A0A540NC79_MALBA|nr:hypothetical protein C1H46_005738 [Malus baccata]